MKLHLLDMNIPLHQLWILLFYSTLSVNLWLFLSDCIAAVSATLEDSLSNTAKATLQAIGAQEAALQAITRHTHKLKEAMEAEVQYTVEMDSFMIKVTKFRLLL